MTSAQRRFIERFGSVYERSPWVAEEAALLVSTDADTDVIARALARCVDLASPERQLELIRSHPDLAGKLALAGELTEASREEQSSAGLDRCSPTEMARFRELNRAYRDKFGFPFVMAVRGRGRGEILESFERRLGNDYSEEFRTALIQVHAIARSRLAALESAGEK